MIKAKHTCIDCGKLRLVELRDGKPRNERCRSCSNRLRKQSEIARAKIGVANSGVKNGHWRGGGYKYSINGYIAVLLYPDDFFFPMAMGNRYVLKHRLVMAKHLGRCLQSWEIVHHKNGNKQDNRIGNLQLTSDLGHKQITILENKIRGLENRVTLLEAENVALRAESKY